MDINKMLADLRAEREQIEEAIMTLERLARGRGKRRGRPPAWMSNIKRRGRPPGCAWPGVGHAHYRGPRRQKPIRACPQSVPVRALPAGGWTAPLTRPAATAGGSPAGHGHS